MKSILNLHFFTFNINNEKYIKIRKTSKEDIDILYSTVFNTFDKYFKTQFQNTFWLILIF